LIDWVKDIFLTDEDKNTFVSIRLLYPQVSLFQWRDKAVYIRRLNMLNKNGNPFTLKNYLDQWISQAGKCLICPSRSPILDPLTLTRSQISVIDHNHRINRVRGLLCGRCNVFIGSARESKRRLARAIVYLEEEGNYESDDDEIDDGVLLASCGDNLFFINKK